MSSTIAPFKERLKHALESPNLEQALERALGAFRERRAASFAPGEFLRLRQDLVERKNAALDHLPELVQQFKEEAEKVGAEVHFAKDAEEARRIVARLAKERGVRLAVKTKSMATEEIELNPFLEEQGIRVVETDLGEWILQLGNDHPSHLIAPAIHWRREEVADLFSKVTGEKQPAVIAELVKVARKQLRQAFIDADMGITGGNIGIAESGTIVLVTNEGNADLVTTLPPIHVAVIGVEKIVATLDDAVAVLKLLPRSATGQRLSSYTNFITGPSRTADIELSMTIGVHGPKEVHIILLDNGRWALRDDPDYRDALRCIRCAACANVCPPYQAVGGHAFGYIYNGPIGIILSAQHHGLESAAGPQSLCAGCNACETICPAGIPLPRMIMGVRQRWVAQEGMPWVKRTALGTFADRRSFEGWMGIARLLQSPFKGNDGFLRLPFGPDFRSLPGLPKQTLHQKMKGRSPEPAVAKLARSGIAGKQVDLFPGCISNLFYPEMGEAMASVVEAMGGRVTFPQEQWCCGLAVLNAGDREGAKPLARLTIEVLEGCEGAQILSGSASCVAAIQQDYLDLFKDDPEWLARAQAVGRRVVDFTSFVDRAAGPVSGIPRPAGSTTPATYHDSCQSFNCLGLQDEGRRALRELAGIEVAEMAESSVCCGFGGSFSVDHPDVAERVLNRKLKNIDATNAPLVVTDNPGCIMHLRGGLDARSKRDAQAPNPRVRHLAEVLAEAFRSGD